MRLTQVSVAMVCIGMMFTACQKEKPLSPKQATEKADPGNGEDRMAALFDKMRDKFTERFQISAGKDNVLETQDGVIIRIAANSLVNPDGTQAQGMLTVEFLGNFDRGSQAIFNMPAESGLDADGNGDAPLVTGGSFDLDIKNEAGENLTAPNGGVIVELPEALTGNDPAGMTIWVDEAGTDQDRDNGWAERPIPVEAVNGRYMVNMPEGLGRCNVDRSVNYSLPTSLLSADIVGPWDNTNAEIFVAFPGNASLQGTVASMDVYDPSTGIWTEHGSLAQTGANLAMIAFGEDANGNFHYVIQNIPSINPVSHHEVISGMAPGSILQMVADINNL